MTSIFIFDKLESRPQKMKTTSKKMEDGLNQTMEDDLKKNGRQPQKKWKTSSTKHGRRLQKIKKWTTSITIKSTLIGCDIIVNCCTLHSQHSIELKINLL
jgi:hypothetical protein